ncbi:hypothetical protein KJI95_11470 [Shewanella sp. JM162201]|uniref:Outer membrane protein beta-barrel domain-containing protein n=1 Tax=Shewanella jiangmenensis TaxID=2837387 RepID=A0ABS5V3W2_9GAMM|nr:hypothetical protein [Shewanella jiangmenensis]MBT1445139.1 hypothetical protein [Shewanella jiangmenensis]
MRAAVLMLSVLAAPAMAQGPEYELALGWDSKYVSEGRDNLGRGGIGWAVLAASFGNLTPYAVVGRADSEAFTEWNFGLEYALELMPDLDAHVGIQQVETYADERLSETELFAELAWHRIDWLIPSVAYTYSFETSGYFVELSLHSNWHIGEQFTLSPYITQGLDYQYVTEAHNGRNHLQFGLEAEYMLSDSLAVSGHISRSIAGHDIELEMGDEARDETFAGIHLHWSF